MDFDKLSEKYEMIHNKNIRISGESSDFFSKYKVRVLHSFYLKNKVERPIKVLDLGCGIGKIERYIFSYFPKAEVYGIDPAAESIKRASYTNKRALFSVYDGKNIPFESGYFHATLISCVLHHVLSTGREHLLNEARRVLKENGYLFVFEHNPFNPLTRYIVKTCVFDIDAHLLTKRNCVNILKNSGFYIIETQYIVFFPKILKFFRKFESKLIKCPLGAQYFIAAKKAKI